LGAIHEIGALCALDEALASGAGEIASRLQRHGILVRTHVLENTSRRLLPERSSRAGRALASLRSALDELALLIEPQLQGRAL